MKKVYVIVKLEKDDLYEHWRFYENDAPGSLLVYTTFRHAKTCVETLAGDLKLCGWRDHVFYQIENVREWHDLSFKKKRIALLIIEEDLIV